MKKAADNSSTPVDTHRFHSIDYVKITVFGFALAALWSSLHTVILQVRLLDFVAESQKNTYLGFLSSAGLILAMVVQPIAGAISDRSGFRWGRRRPYILLGTILTVLLLPGIALCSSYTALFIIYCWLQVSSNMVQGPFQGFIPDLVPQEKRGTASGVKTLFELLGGIALLCLISPFMDHYLLGEGNLWLWLALIIPAIVLLGMMIATVIMVKEPPVIGISRMPLLATMCKSFKIDVKANNSFVWFLVSRLLILMAFAALQRFALYFLMDVVGIASPAAVTANLLIVVGICMVIAVYPAGRLADKVGRQPIVIASGLFSAVGIILLLFSTNYGYIMFCGAILGFSGGTFLSTDWALATDLLAKGEEARYLGLTNLATAGGAALTLLIIGPMIDFFNTCSPNLGYSIMFILCFICFVAGSLMVIKIKPGHQPI
ncbi:MFS transporter [Chloroflexota bacterium]